MTSDQVDEKRWKRVKLATHCGSCHAIEVYPRLARIGAKTQLVPQAFVPKRSARFFLGQDVECWTGPIISGGRILWELWDEFLETLETLPSKQSEDIQNYAFLLPRPAARVAREMSNSNDFPGGTQSPVSAPHFFWSSVISPPAGLTNFTETSVGSSSTRVTSRLDLDIQTFWSTQIAVVYEFL